MPTYEYRCKECGEGLEVVQSFTDDALTICPACGGPLRKVFGNIGVTFKGSGFYKTDSRGGSSKSASSTSTSGDSSKESSSKESSSTSSSTSDSSSSSSSSKDSSGSSSSGSTSAA